MRVYDLAMRADIPEGPSASRALRAITTEAVVVHAQPVWDWYAEQNRALADGQAVLRLIERCVPPFATTMVEYADGADPGWHIGAVIYNEQTDNGSYLIHVGYWMSDLQKKIAAFPGFASVPVSAAGVPDWSQYRLGFDDDASDDARSLGHQTIAEVLCVSLLTFRFMHARGVEVRDTVPPRHERRRAEKEGKPAPVTYKRLEIGAMRRTLEAEGGISEVGIARALHICRGHFADYTKGAGLFGKHKVEVFVPEHVRGRSERGVVQKDYAIAHAALPQATTPPSAPSRAEATPTGDAHE